MIEIKESYVNKTDDRLIGDTDWFVTFYESIGDLFDHCQKEHGRCTGKVFQDIAEFSVHTGWVFEKRQPYTDRPSWTYIHETWVTFDPMQIG